MQTVEAPKLPGYTAIPASILRAWGCCKVDLFQLVSWSPKPQLFCSANYRASPIEIETLADNEAISLYVSDYDYPCLQADLYKRLGDLIEHDEIPLRDRYQVVKNVVATEVHKVFQSVNLDSAIGRFHYMGHKISQLVCSSDIVSSELLAIAMHDTGTFKHLINVSTYAVLLARHLGIVDKNELTAIATGGLLHDIGKRFMPKQLLSKRAALTEKQRQLISLHPVKGYVELHKYDDFSVGQRMMVYQHHERMDGQGYPVGITGEEIHLWARICALVDVHEALTGRRDYRKSDSISKVLEYLGNNAGTQFDKEIFQCWKQIMQ
jgi:putative nucleotidyltransferase with HDIG domain